MFLEIFTAVKSIPQHSMPLTVHARPFDRSDKFGQRHDGYSRKGLISEEKWERNTIDLPK